MLRRQVLDSMRDMSQLRMAPSGFSRLLNSNLLIVMLAPVPAHVLALCVVAKACSVSRSQKEAGRMQALVTACACIGRAQLRPSMFGFRFAVVGRINWVQSSAHSTAGLSGTDSWGRFVRDGVVKGRK